MGVLSVRRSTRLLDKKKSISFYLPNPFFLSLHGEKFHHYFATLDTLIICFY